jgi:hypothetical protein
MSAVVLDVVIAMIHLNKKLDGTNCAHPAPPNYQSATDPPPRHNQHRSVQSMETGLVTHQAQIDQELRHTSRENHCNFQATTTRRMSSVELNIY